MTDSTPASELLAPVEESFPALPDDVVAPVGVLTDPPPPPLPASSLNSSSLHRTSLKSSDTDARPPDPPPDAPDADVPASIPDAARMAAFLRARDALATLAAASVAALSDEELLREVVDTEAVGRVVDGLRATLAGEVADRSRWELGQAGLGYRYGDRKAPLFLARLTGATRADAARRIRLGTALRAPTTLDGTPLPPPFPELTEAVTCGRVGVEAALAIATTMGDAARTAPPEDITAAVHELVAAAADGEPADGIRGQALVWREVLDPDGAQPRDEVLRGKRAFRLGRERDGLTPFSGTLDPLRAALVRAAMEEGNRPGIEPRYLAEEDRTDRTVEVEQPDGTIAVIAKDPRTREQRQCDTLLGLIEAGLRTTGTGPNGFRHTTEVVVVVSAGDLTPGLIDTTATPTNALARSEAETGTTPGTGEDADADADTDADSDAGQGSAGDWEAVTGRRTGTPCTDAPPDCTTTATTDSSDGTRPGVGWIDGGEEPVSTATVEELICSHGYRIQTVGPDGEILHQSKHHRYFTARQIRALAVRDGGCVWPGCDAPPTHCDAHHVQEFALGGNTRTHNGVLLCTHHHHMLHNSPYRIRIHHGRPQMLAPTWIDPDQKWIPLGKSRLEKTRRLHARR
jgi:hypothetical protein